MPCQQCFILLTFHLSQENFFSPHLHIILRFLMSFLQPLSGRHYEKDIHGLHDTELRWSEDAQNLTAVYGTIARFSFHQLLVLLTHMRVFI